MKRIEKTKYSVNLNEEAINILKRDQIEYLLSKDRLQPLVDHLKFHVSCPEVRELKEVLEKYIRISNG